MALSALLCAALPPERLRALPPALGRRSELRALGYAVLRQAGVAGAEGRNEYLNALSWNLARLDRLDAILAAARSAGLRLVPLKGALLGRTHYGDPGARPMVDVDLLCAPEELARALELLGDLGFRRVPHPAFRRARDGVHDVQLENGPVLIELHYRLWHELALRRDPSGLIGRAEEVAFGPGRAWAPRAADHLYLVLVHAAVHGFGGNPLWLIDALLLLADAGPVVWSEVEALAAAGNARVPLACARDQLGLALGLDVAAPPDVARLRRALLRQLGPWLWRGEAELGVWPSRLVRPLLHERPRDALVWARDKLRLWRPTSPPEPRVPI